MPPPIRLKGETDLDRTIEGLILIAMCLLMCFSPFLAKKYREIKEESIAQEKATPSKETYIVSARSGYLRKISRD